MSNENYDLFEGERRKKDGISRAEIPEKEKVHLLRSYAIKRAQIDGTVTADDVRKYAEENGISLKPNAWGAVFRPKVHGECGRLIQQGWTKSHLVSNHARVNRVWAWLPNA